MNRIRSLTITLPEPCSQDWDEMQPVGCGRFCDACQKTVVDFTGMTDEQVIKVFEEQSNVCGRFGDDQLDRILITSPDRTTFRITFIQKIAASLLIIAGLFNEANAQQAKKKMQTVATSRETGMADLHNYVFVKLLGGRDEEPLQGISVNACEPVTGVLLGSGVSDAKGILKINIGFYPGDTVRLRAVTNEISIKDVMVPVSNLNAITYYKVFGSFVSNEETLPETIVTGYQSIRRTYTLGGISSVRDLPVPYTLSLWRRVIAPFRKLLKK